MASLKKRKGIFLIQYYVSGNQRRISFPLYVGSLQAVASPCWESTLPDIISTVLVQAFGPLPRGVRWGVMPVSSRRTSASP